jgi:hypothetical protein
MVLVLAVIFGEWAARAAETGEPSASPASDAVLRQQLGDGLPTPIPLWFGKPPQFLENAPPETVVEHAHIKSVSLPTLSAYLPPAEKSTGMAIVICPGGGYDEGGHGLGNLIPQRVKSGFPPAQWPELLLTWLASLPKS